MFFKTLVLFLLAASGSGALADDAQCGANDFRDAVAKASASITRMHEANNKVFQEKLQRLKVSNHWSDQDFIARATPFVKDDVTASLDVANQALLARIQSLESANASTVQGRCAMLDEVRASMDKVVANTTAKWDHMLAKVHQASTSIEAGMSR